jgi:hypothetical protein
MRTVTIQRYNQLSGEQWRRVTRSVKRQVRNLTGKPVEIGIGRKYANGIPFGRRVAIRVYVPRKRQRVSSAKRIPGLFRIRLKRPDGKYDLLKIRSDVDSLADYVPTSARVRLGTRTATTGLLLRWNDAKGAVKWGFATVGHLFDDTSRRVASVRVHSTAKFQCRLFKNAPKRKRVDVAVLRIVGSRKEIERKLQDCDLISKSNLSVIKLMRVRQVHRAAIDRRRGRTVSPDGDQVFTGEEVFPDGFLLGTRRLDDCIRVAQARNDTFKQGTSGAHWCFGSRVACMQVGGKANEFCEGIGQPMDSLLPWIRSTLGHSVKVVAVLD